MLHVIPLLMQQNLNITLTPNLLHSIHNSAKEQGVDISTMICQILTAYYSSKKNIEVSNPKKHGIAKFRGILNNASPEALRSDYIQEKYNV